MMEAHWVWCILINVTKVYFMFSTRVNWHISSLLPSFLSQNQNPSPVLLWEKNTETETEGSSWVERVGGSSEEWVCWKEVKWVEKEGEKGIGSAAVATTGTTPSDHSATDASNPASSSTPKPPLIPSGSLVLAIGSAPVSYFAPNHLQINQFLFFSFSFIHGYALWIGL